jgi:hypothetical protein
MAGLQVVCQIKGWKVQQIVFVGGTCGYIHVESFNRNMKAFHTQPISSIYSNYTLPQHTYYKN